MSETQVRDWLGMEGVFKQRLRRETAQNLICFQEWFAQAMDAMQSGVADIPLDYRFAHLDVDEMFFMQGILYYEGKVLLESNWEYVPQDLVGWSDLLPVEDNEYHWWQVSEVSPGFELPSGAHLVVIELNSRHDWDDVGERFDRDSEFEIGFVTDEELQRLLNCLGRHNE